MARRALISVTDKSDLGTLVAGLSRHNFEIVSTGGTAARIREIIAENDHEIKLCEVAEVTGSPEMFDGRVKTLDPRIHGGILYDRDDPNHVKQAEENGIVPIDLVVVNLYQFERTVAQEGVTEREVIESIDIGGPSMMMSAIKNCAHVGIIADPESYETIIAEMDENSGKLTFETRRTLAAFAINKIADYRSAIAVELTRRFTGEETLRQKFVQGKKLGRYGENWHQQAWLFETPGVTEPNVVTARQVHGFPLGYNNYVDANAALNAVKELESTGAAIIKHTNPCGYGTGNTLENALERACQGDPVSAFGSVIALNREVDLATMKVICERTNPAGKKGWFVEVMIAPKFSEEALEYVQRRKGKKRLRLLEVSGLDQGERETFELRHLLGGVLQQTRDDSMYLASSIDELFREPYILLCENSDTKRTVGIVTERKPGESKKGLYDFAMKAAKHTKSNAIVICREYSPGYYQVLGMGAGQPNRKDSGGKLAITKAHENLALEYDILLEKATAHAQVMLASEYDQLLGTKDERVGERTKDDYVRNQLEKHCVLASDAFFPFRDGIDAIAGFGIKNVIQPGGSNRDAEVIVAANEYDMAMIFTGVRHFKH